MILVDFSQIIHASVHVDANANECAKNPSEQSKSMLKHFILNSLRSNFVIQKKQYGQLVVACDYGSWRYDVFPNYKCQRKASKKVDESGINWAFVEEMSQELIQEMKDYFPFPVIRTSKAEGDDCIGTLVKYLTETDVMEEDIFGNTDHSPILIMSSDRDNFQLHKYKHVRQWSPVEKKLIRPSVPVKHALLEKIVKGESGKTSDSIPNYRMNDDTFIDGIRQKPVSQKILDAFFAADNPLDVCESEEEKKNFLRNELLVSYEKIPQNISDDIITCYNEQVGKKHSKMGLMSYFTQRKMSNLLGQIHDFYL